MGVVEVHVSGPMRSESTRSKRETIPARSRALVPAAATCGLLWVGAVLVAGLKIDGGALVVLGVGGVLATTVLLLMIQRQYSRLRNLAGTDALTGLVNHRSFHEILAEEITDGAEARRPVAVVILDLDNFKAINDTHGHPYGDEVLRAVGAAVRTATRADDTAARIGGEEFALILPGSDSGTAFAVAERTRAAVAAVAVHGFELSCSAGVAAYPDDAEDASTLCQLADSALCWAKRGGKRRTRRFDPEHSPATWTDRQRTEVEQLLRLDRPITPVFQPVVGLGTGRVVGYEALARFPGTSGRTPDVWFAQAHGCGLGPELEAAAIKAALEPVGRPFDVHLAINVSPSALTSDLVRDALRGNLEGIVVEITEHEFVPDDDSLAAAIAELRGRGARIAIDDAGAGHAGLKQLMRVRPDIVKLDRALTHDIHRDAARMALVESFARFARDVGATVCGEGIELLDELAVLADLDVQWGQGFVLARPEPPWTEVSPIAAEVCRVALADTFRSLPTEHHPIGSSDRRLVHLSARLASARTPRDLESALALIAAELGSSKVCLSAWHEAEQVLETLAENGERSDQTIFPIAEYPLSAKVIREQEAVQTVVSDPESDPSEVELLLSLGERSALMVPVVSRGESIGIVEAFRSDERAWSRAEINRARVIANQFASVIPMLAAERDREAADQLRVERQRS
jgi:diguanylate cyclase (GGDEF)-like protein